MKRRTFTDRELREMADLFSVRGPNITDLAHYALALQRALRNVTDPHRKADIAKDIEKARALLAPRAKRGSKKK